MTLEEKEQNISGFFDIHTHGTGGYDTRTTRPENILRIARAHGKAGTAAILPAIYSGTVDTMRDHMDAVRKSMEVQKTEGPKPVKHHSSQILGVYLEGPFLNPLMCGAQDKGTFLKPSIQSLKELINGYDDIIKVITIAPELPGALKVIERCAALGIRVNMGHSEATYRQALNGKKAGATGITHIFNTMRPFHHREPGLIGLGLLDEDIYIEVIADMVHIDSITLQMIFRTKRLDRIILISDSVKGVKNSKGRIYLKPGILAGSAIVLSEAVKNVTKTGITEAVALETAIDNPKRYLGIKN
jgi:N-acetylglucosamine-6-phosphate deacetylase